MRDVSTPPTDAEPGSIRDASPTPTREGFTCASCRHFVVTAVTGVFTNPKVGSPARFCSPACRTAAWRRRRAGVPEDTPRQHHGGPNRSLTRPDRR
jgi:hypothetical protein